jgi:hypothetical protein
MYRSINNTDDFDFLDSASDEDFFSIEEEKEEEEIVDPKKPNKVAGKQTPTIEEDEEQEEEEEDLFSSSEEGSEEQEEEEEEEEEDNSETLEGDSISALALLKKRGIVDYTLEEGEVLTEAKAEEILEDSLDNMFEERIEELFDGTPEILKEMNKFVLKGGDISDFLEKISIQNTSGLTEGMDMENEDNQEKVIRHGLKQEGYDEEYIAAQIEFLKDSKRLKKHSETHFNKWDTKRKEEQKQILKSQEDKTLKEKESRRALKTKVSTFLEETSEISGFTISKIDKRELPNYMSDRTVKLDNGNQITSMQRDLMRVLNNPTGSVQIAKLLKSASESGELDFKDIEKETKTKVAKEVRENVRRNKKSIIAGSAGGAKKKRPLADYFSTD